MEQGRSGNGFFAGTGLVKPALMLALAWCSAAPAHAADAVFNITVREGRVAAPERTLRAGQHDRVEIVIQTDQPVDVHLHGYNIEASARPGAPARIVFEAGHAGRFPIEVHAKAPRQGHRILSYVEILPR